MIQDQVLQALGMVQDYEDVKGSFGRLWEGYYMFYVKSCKNTDAADAKSRKRTLGRRWRSVVSAAVAAGMALCLCTQPLPAAAAEQAINPSPAQTTDGKTEQAVLGNGFNQIAFFMTPEEVVQIMGYNGSLVSQSQHGGHCQTLYIWRGDTGSAAYVYFDNGQVNGKSEIGLVQSTEPATPEQIAQVRQGMTYEEVQEVMPGLGAIKSFTYFFGRLREECEWVGSDGNVACTISFTDGRVTSVKQRESGSGAQL